jgi:xylose isomerase
MTEFIMPVYFDQLDRVRFEGPKTANPLAFRHYNPDEIVLGKRMAEHLRFAACYWHNFCWNGAICLAAVLLNDPGNRRGCA